MNGKVNATNVRLTNKEYAASNSEQQQQMDCYYDGDDLIDSESGDPEKDRAVWTETALDILIAIYNDLQNSTHHLQFRTKKETYNYIEDKMTRRGYKFTWNQIENKLKALKRIYLRRKRLHQEIEPELANMFEENEENDENDWEKESSETPQKRVRFNAGTEDTQSPDRDGVLLTKVGWNEEATKVLVTLVREMKPLVGVSATIKTKRQMWEQISTKMSKLNLNFTSTQIGNKWKSLCRSDRKKNQRDEFYNMDNSTFFNTDVDDGNDTDDSLLGADDPSSEDCIDDTKNCENSDVKKSENSDVQNNENSNALKLTPNDIKDANNDNPSSSNIQILAQSCMDIANSFSQIQAESNKIAAQKINLKEMQIQAYKERTKEMKEIGSHLSELVKHFKRRDHF